MQIYEKNAFVIVAIIYIAWIFFYIKSFRWFSRRFYEVYCNFNIRIYFWNFFKNNQKNYKKFLLIWHINCGTNYRKDKNDLK